MNEKILSLLDLQVMNCKECYLFGNNVKPYWTSKSKYVIIGEAPGRDEVKENMPFVGKAGKILSEALSSIGMEREDFLIINSVNCRPVNNGKNGKPSVAVIEICKKRFLIPYLKVVNPSHGLLLGNYATGAIFNEYSGITKVNGEEEQGLGINFTKCLHPASVIYNKENEEKFKESFRRFYERIKSMQ